MYFLKLSAGRSVSRLALARSIQESASTPLPKLRSSLLLFLRSS